MALPTLNQVIPHLATGANPLRPLPTHTRPSGRSNATVHSERSQSCDGALKSSWRWLGTAVAAAALSAQAAFSPPSFAMASPQAEALQQHTERTVPYAMTSPEVLGRLPPLPANFPQLPPLRRPNFERFTLPSGLRVILLEDHEALLVRGVMLMRGGQRANPPGKVGLASISAAAQRAGGSKAHPGQALEEALEDMSAAIEGGASAEAVSMGFSCLAEDAPQVLSLFAELITDPALPGDKIELFKAQAMNSYLHRNDNPSAIPAREAARLVYGRDSVYVQQPSIKGLSGISVEDARQWLGQWERPDTAVLGIVGDFEAKEMAKLVKQSLGGWRVSSPGPSPTLPSSPLPDPASYAGRIFLVDRPGATQASIATAEVGISMMDPDECALDVLGDLLNSFGGRLFDEIRSREGLAYSVTGGWASAPPDHPGLFLATAETARPVELLRALRAALATAAQTAPAEEELAQAKEERANSFVFGFASAPAQLRRAVTSELFGIPEDYPFKYQARLAKVSAKDVEAAAARHLHPTEGQVTVVVADAKSVKLALEQSLGKSVEELALD